MQWSGLQEHGRTHGWQRMLTEGGGHSFPAIWGSFWCEYAANLPTGTRAQWSAIQHEMRSWPVAHLLFLQHCHADAGVDATKEACLCDDRL